MFKRNDSTSKDTFQVQELLETRAFLFLKKYLFILTKMVHLFLMKIS